MRGVVVGWAVGMLLALGGVTEASASKGAGLIPVKVEFAGSGTYAIEEQYVGSSCTVTTHDPFALAWKASFTTVLTEGTLADTNGVLGGGPSTYSFSSTGAGAYCPQVAAIAFPACTADVPISGTPYFEAHGGGKSPIEFKAQSLVTSGSDSCEGVGTVDAAGRDLSIFAMLLPDAFTATGAIPPRALDTGAPYTVNVQGGQESGGAVGNCLGIGRPATGNIACDATLSWSGTVTFKPMCAHKLGEKLPLCVKEQTKHDAAEAAKEYTEGASEQRIEINEGLGCHTGGKREVKWACALAAARLLYDDEMARRSQKVAKDPPSDSYKQVVKPHSLKLHGLGPLTRFPHVIKLAKGYAKVAGLLEAILVSEDRATGAFLAMLKGDASATRFLLRQDRAVHSYAKQAAAILAGQHKLLLQAAAEARHEGLPGLILAKQLKVGAHARADRLLAAGLRAIGR